MAYFILDVVSELDLSGIESVIQSRDPRGNRPHSPRMMVCLLLYGYSVGVVSSRKIERATYEDVAFRVLAGGGHPDHVRISEFRRVHLESFKGLFGQVLQLCGRAGLAKVGQIAVDGTKIQGNASKHRAMSYARMEELERRLGQEVERLLEEAERQDQAEDERFGVGQREEDLPEELRRREDRIARLRQAKAELEAEARRSRAAQLREQAERARRSAEKTEDTTVSKRHRARSERLDREAEELDDEGPATDSAPSELPLHRTRALTDGTPHPRAQHNFTDPESCLMESGGSFLQGYNCQAAVNESQVILAADVTNQPPDNGNLLPMLEQVRDNCGTPPEVALADSGYWAPDVPEQAAKLGIDTYIATERRRHWDTNDTLTEGPPPEDADPREAMRWKLRTKAGREIYARRKTIVEPVFGQTKEARGYRRFLLRGLDAVRGEWTLLCTGHNLLKLFRAQNQATA